MNIGTEQVFLVNATELDQQNQHTPTALQRTFVMPVAVAAMEPEAAQTSLCLPQSMGPPSRTQMCRLCATTTEMVVPIFQGEGLQNNLADKIHQHLPIQVSESDLLPVVMCFQCTSTLLAWHELVVCSVQADSVMRERFNLSFTQHHQQPSAQSSQNQVKDEKSQALPKIIRTVIAEYLLSLNMDAQVELVCQRCDSRPASKASHFADHLITTHHSEVLNENAVNSFIKDNVTFEEPLLSDFESDKDDKSNSDVTEQSKTVKMKKNMKKKKSLTVLCPYCDSAFSSPSRLMYHLSKHMEISIEDGVKCCDSTFNTKRGFVSHLQEKHVTRLVLETDTMCKSCNLNAESPEQLRLHVAECHSENKVKKLPKKSDKNQKWIPAVCPRCNKTFSNKYNMFTHMKAHERAQTHACRACGKRYSSKGNLRHHIKLVHEGQLPHVCGACGERFPTRAARDVHARLHTGDRPFRCELCGAAFRAENTLLCHLDVHLDVRKHECEICAKTFRKRSHLAAHGRTHRN